jgi:hypothetical protein
VKKSNPLGLPSTHLAKINSTFKSMHSVAGPRITVEKKPYEKKIAKNPAGMMGRNPGVGGRFNKF